MIEGYYIDQFGIVHQDYKECYVYDDEYVNNLNSSDDIQRIRLDYISKNINKLNIKCLELGPGNGHFITYLKANNTDIKIDGYDVFDSKFTTISKQETLETHYDLILLYDVLEHFSDMNELFQYNFKNAIISSPYCKSPEWLCENYDKWHHFKPNEHLHYFNEKSLEKWCNHNGYTLEDYCFIEDYIRKPIITDKNIGTYLIKRINDEI